MPKVSNNLIYRILPVGSGGGRALSIGVCVALSVALIGGGVSGCAPKTSTGAHMDAAYSVDSSFNEHNIAEGELKNGMRVIIKRDSRAPIAVVQVWYSVGSSDEPPGLTGISHALEHMMFKDAKRFTRQSRTDILKDEGGRYNAFTSADYTAYYEALHRDKMELAFDIESDRMINLQLRQEDFDKEIEVVKEERRLRVSDRPHSKLYEEFYASAFSNSPYRHPVIGWMDDLNNMTLDDLQYWYDKWYMPNNALLVVAGDVEIDEVMQLAQKYFAPIPARKLPERKPHNQMLRHVERNVKLTVPAKEPLLVIGYHAPVIGRADVEWHPYALWMLTQVLSGSSFARLPTSLVRGSELARSARASYSPFSRYNSLFIFTATPQHGVDIDAVRMSLLEEIEKIKTAEISDKEMNLAITRARAYRVYKQDLITEQATHIGRAETMGYDWEQGQDFVEGAQKVTAEQVRQVARQYLTAGRRTTAILVPQESTPTATAAGGQ